MQKFVDRGTAEAEKVVAESEVHYSVVHQQTMEKAKVMASAEVPKPRLVQETLERQHRHERKSRARVRGEAAK